jgi:hypothetical protein
MTFRVMDGLTRNLGRTFSIQDLTNEIRRTRGRAHYANVYNCVQSLKRQGLIELSKTGGTSTISLNLRRYALIDVLAEMEIERKRRALRSIRMAESLFAAVDAALGRLSSVAAVAAIDAERNLRLNRLELLVLMRDDGGSARIHEALADLKRLHSTRIDDLGLTEREFVTYLTSEEKNPISDMMAEEIAFIYPQALWSAIARASGRKVPVRGPALHPARLTEAELSHNLERFGYPMMGTARKSERDICLEYVVIAALLGEDARRKLAVPVILSKNAANPRLLAFLAAKYRVGDVLLGQLQVLARMKVGPEVKETVAHLRQLGAKPADSDARAIRQTLRTYDAVG